MIVKHNIKSKVVWGYRYSYKLDGKWKVKSVRSSKWTKREAEQHEMKFVQSLEKINGDSLKFLHLFEMYFDYKKVKLKLRAYRDTRTASERHILPFFGDLLLNDINTHIIENWQQNLLKATYLKSGVRKIYSNRQLEKVQINLNAMLTFAFERELINRNPFKSVGIAKRRLLIEEEEEKRFITVDEFNRIINAIETIEKDELRKAQDLVTFSILFWCGLRKGELMALDVKDYNFIKKELRIYKNWDYVNKIITTPKTSNSVRTVIVPDIVDEYIIKLVSLYRQMIDYNPDKSLISYYGRINSNSLTKRKDKYCKITGIKATLHDFRHSHVSMLINSGLQPFEIAKRLGHTVEMVNEVYGHLYPSKQLEMVDLMNKAS